MLVGIIIFLVGILVGIVVGIILGTINEHKNAIGNLRVDHSDPDSQPYLFLELKKGVPSVMNERYVTLRVMVKDFVSQD